jgi:hypothetical protein
VKSSRYTREGGLPAKAKYSFSSSSFVDITRDARPLPMPFGKKQRSAGEPPMYWDWSTWLQWYRRCVSRGIDYWRKSAVRRFLVIRDEEAAQRGDSANFFDANMVEKRAGAIYAMYHFTTGRWYVGQTIGTVPARAKGHWYARNRATEFS